MVGTWSMGIAMEYEELYEKYKKLLGEVNRLTEENSQLKAQLGLTKSETPQIINTSSIKPEINYRDDDFVTVLRKAGRADLILDMVGGAYIPRDIKALKDDGRLVFIAFLGGPKAEVNFAEVMVRRLTVTGSTLRPQSDVAKARIAQALRTQVWPLLSSGAIGPVMDREFPLDQAADAHRALEADHIGKIVLNVGEADD